MEFLKERERIINQERGEKLKIHINSSVALTEKDYRQLVNLARNAKEKEQLKLQNEEQKVWAKSLKKKVEAKAKIGSLDFIKKI